MKGASTAEIAQMISAIAASAAAIFAAVSAGVSRVAVERGNLAFVWPEFWIVEPDTLHKTARLLVRLHSDGPGIALDVRWSVFFHTEPGRKAMRGAEEEAAANATPAIERCGPGKARQGDMNPRPSAHWPRTCVMSRGGSWCDGRTRLEGAGSSASGAPDGSLLQSRRGYGGRAGEWRYERDDARRPRRELLSPRLIDR